jgi:hypothetical protein
VCEWMHESPAVGPSCLMGQHSVPNSGEGGTNGQWLSCFWLAFLESHILNPPASVFSILHVRPADGWKKIPAQNAVGQFL